MRRATAPNTAAALALSLLLAGAGCRRAQPAAEPLVLGDVAIPGLSLVFVARHQGLFDAQGVAITARRFASGREALAALVAREVDVATVLETPIAGAAFDAPGLRVLTMLHASRQDTRVVAREDRGIRSAADLRGRRVGVPRGTNADFFLDLLLRGAGVRPHEVTRVDLAPGAAAAALGRGEVDAISIWHPHARRQPGTVELRSNAYVEVSMLVTRDDVLAARPEALHRALRALAAAEDRVAADPAAAVDALARELPGVAPDDLRDDLRRNPPQLGISNVQLRILEGAAEWQRARRGPDVRVPDIRRLLAPAPLLAVEPEAVTLLGVE